MSFLLLESFEEECLALFMKIQVWWRQQVADTPKKRRTRGSWYKDQELRKLAYSVNYDGKGRGNKEDVSVAGWSQAPFEESSSELFPRTFDSWMMQMKGK